MFTRVVEITSKAGKARDLARTVSEKVLTILKNQPGFMDEITLVSDEDPNRIVAISFWKSKEHADAYDRDQFNKVTETISNQIEGTPGSGRLKWRRRLCTILLPVKQPELKPKLEHAGRKARICLRYTSLPHRREPTACRGR